MDIFKNRHDYAQFLGTIENYLSAGERKTRSNLVANDINLICYCLMPNHFHLLCQNKTETGITKLMRRILTSYALFFNKRYGREGPVIQGNYRAVLIKSEEQLVHDARYIHINPGKTIKVANYAYSSLKYYLKKEGPDWLTLADIISPTLETLKQTLGIESSDEMDSWMIELSD